jgi:hypothetical protein
MYNRSMIRIYGYCRGAPNFDARTVVGAMRALSVRTFKISHVDLVVFRRIHNLSWVSLRRFGTDGHGGGQPRPRYLTNCS